MSMSLAMPIRASSHPLRPNSFVGNSYGMWARKPFVGHSCETNGLKSFRCNSSANHPRGVAVRKLKSEVERFIRPPVYPDEARSQRQRKATSHRLRNSFGMNVYTLRFAKPFRMNVCVMWWGVAPLRS